MTQTPLQDGKKCATKKDDRVKGNLSRTQQIEPYGSDQSSPNIFPSENLSTTSVLQKLPQLVVFTSRK